MISKSRLLIVIIFVLCSSKVMAYIDRQISQLDGLSHHYANVITKDSKESLWIGTKNGVNRLFENRVETDKFSHFYNHNVKRLFTDNADNIWIASDKETHIYNISDESISPIEYDGQSVTIEAYVKTKDEIVISCIGELFTYDYNSATLKRLELDTPLDATVRSLDSIDDNTILAVDFRGNLYKIELDKHRAIKLERNSSIFAVYVDSKGNIWTTIHNNGIRRYAIEGDRFKIVETFNTSNSQLSSNAILSMQEMDGELWVSTDGGGINILDMDSHKFYSLKDLVGKRIDDRLKTVTHIYVENENSIWFATTYNGIINIQKNSIYNIPELEDKPIKAICEGANGYIWIGSDDYGIYRYDPSNQDIRHIDSSLNKKVTDIIELNDNTLLVSAYNEGISIFDKRSERFTSLNDVNKEISEYIIDKLMIAELCKLDQNRAIILIGNICLYDNGKLSIIDENIEGRRAWEDKKSIGVIGDKSIYTIDKQTLKIERIFDAEQGYINAARKSGDDIYFLLDQNLFRMNSKGGQQIQIESPYNGKILSLEVDNDRLWLTSFNKLIHIEKTNPEYYFTYEGTEGVVPNQYIPNATYISNNGEIYFGGNNGVTIIDKDIEYLTYKESDITIISLYMNDQPLRKDKVINVPRSYKSLSITVGMPNSSLFKENSYLYNFVSKDNSFSVESNNLLQMPALPYGKVNLSVSYKMPNDRWSTPQHIVSFNVEKPWWLKPIFYILVFIICWIIVTIVLYRYHRYKQRTAASLFKDREQDLSNNKVKFLINISHELRTPLTLIYAPLKRILDSKESIESSRGELTKIFTQTKYMTGLINMVLDLRKMEVGEGEVNIQKYNLKEWIGSIVAEFEGEYLSRDIKLTTNIDKECSVIYFDENKFRIVISNLLMNAYKYSKANTEVVITAKYIGDSIRVSVIDQGVGLNGVDIDSIFNRFVQAHGKDKGSGIGLSYSKMLVELHPNGRIGAINRLDERGSIFYFELPKQMECSTIKCDSNSYLNQLFTQTVPSNQDSIDYPLTTHTVLIVEDNSDLLSLLKESLEGYFQNVYTANNGLSALKLTLKHQPSIVISDVMMPKMNGYDLCYSIKNNIEISHIPVILLTAKSDHSSKIDGYKSGSDLYISKPFDIETLLLAARNLLYSRDLLKKVYSKQSLEIIPSNVAMGNADEQFLIKLNGFIIDNISNEALDSQMIIDFMCMGRASFYKKIKAILDMGIMDYVTRQRMSIAKKLVLESHDTIQDISLKVGYVDNIHFSKVFKQHFSQTPLQMRKADVAK